MTPLLFLSITIWTMAWAVMGRPFESLAGLGTVVLRGIIFVMTGAGRPSARLTDAVGPGGERA